MSEKETYVESTPGKLGRWCINIFSSFVLVYLFVPMTMIILFSFNNPLSKSNLTWKGFTLKHWSKTISGGEQTVHFNPELNSALYRSITIGLLASFFAVTFGFLIAMALVKYRVKGIGIISLLLVLPLTIPEIVNGASLATLFRGNVEMGFATIFISHTMFCISYIVFTMKARLKGLDWSIEDAAKDLGANSFKAFYKIILPLAAPGIFAAFLLSFALSFDDYIITNFVNGTYNTFPIEVYKTLRASIPVQLNVLSSILLIITTACFLVPSVLSIRKQKKLAKIRVNTP